MNIQELLDQTPRLQAWTNIGPVQRAELEKFAQDLLSTKATAITADGVLVGSGHTVWVLSSVGRPTKTTVRPFESVTDYYLFGNIPVQHSFSTKQAADDYRKHNQ